MKLPNLITTLFATTALFAAAENPFGLFDFDLRGKDPAEQIRSLDGIGFDGITMPLKTPQDLEKLEAYQKAKPDLKLFAALFDFNYSKPEDFNREHFENVVKKLAAMKAKVWLIVSGPKGKDEEITRFVREVADLAAAGNVDVSLYPHDSTALETAEETLAILKKADRSNLTVSVHQCHEMRAGNTERIDAVMTAVGPYMDIVTLCGSDKKVSDNNIEWSDAIKPLGEGDYDPKEFLRALKRHKFEGPIILHTYGLMKKPASHYRTSYDRYQKMRAEVDAE
ncbi:MAG: sugar phosphate isomerase/epimerase family protein [Luteolibacter sp.]